ncbi:hypothetical protein NEIELOOT_01341 [Neisseria elongata subsp. glycolytica ATCC 29315]|uniref:Uncharacterized protein n=1 Tax=Neisseria elongata subsp. glycolytica ATCC 29315 TaxID=546263 RepID=D4DQK2_NEIEG|nr:hypothetical protein NEIELOOT_01341 [Neisseria elongata subsp. glycolytica ATCC 29315]
MNLFNAAARRPSENQSAGQKRSPHGEGDKTERIHKNKIIVECGSAKGGFTRYWEGRVHAADRTGEIIYEVQFFFNFNLSKILLKTYFF